MDGLNQEKKNVYVGFHFTQGCAEHIANHFKWSLDEAWEILDGENQKVTKTLDRLMEKKGVVLQTRHIVEVQLLKYNFQEICLINFIPKDGERLAVTLNNLEDRDRLVIVGHSDISRFMWGAAPEVLVNFFSGRFKPNANCRISLYCCYAGALSKKDEEIGWADGFYVQMCRKNNMKYSVSARTGKVEVLKKGNEVVKRITSATDVDCYKMVIFDNEGHDDVDFKMPNQGNVLRIAPKNN